MLASEDLTIIVLPTVMGPVLTTLEALIRSRAAGADAVIGRATRYRSSAIF